MLPMPSASCGCKDNGAAATWLYGLHQRCLAVDGGGWCLVECRLLPGDAKHQLQAAVVPADYVRQVAAKAATYLPPASGSDRLTEWSCTLTCRFGQGRRGRPLAVQAICLCTAAHEPLVPACLLLAAGVWTCMSARPGHVNWNIPAGAALRAVVALLDLPCKGVLGCAVLCYVVNKAAQT